MTEMEKNAKLGKEEKEEKERERKKTKRLSRFRRHKALFGNDKAFLPPPREFWCKKKDKKVTFDDIFFSFSLIHRAHLNEIANYDGGDPLEVWLRYARV